MAEHRADDLRLVQKAGREQRPERPDDSAGDQGLLLGGASFALEEAARDLAGGERLFLIIHGQREEILTRLYRAGADSGAQHGRLAIGRQNGAIGLTGDLARLQDELAAAPNEVLAEYLKHNSVVLLRYLAAARRSS